MASGIQGRRRRQEQATSGTAKRPRQLQSYDQQQAGHGSQGPDAYGDQGLQEKGTGVLEEFAEADSQGGDPEQNGLQGVSKISKQASSETDFPQVPYTQGAKAYCPQEATLVSGGVVINRAKSSNGRSRRSWEGTLKRHHKGIDKLAMKKIEHQIDGILRYSTSLNLSDLLKLTSNPTRDPDINGDYKSHYLGISRTFESSVLILDASGHALAALIKNVHSEVHNDRISKSIVDFSNRHRPASCKSSAGADIIRGHGGLVETRDDLAGQTDEHVVEDAGNSFKDLQGTHGRVELTYNLCSAWMLHANDPKPLPSASLLHESAFVLLEDLRFTTTSANAALGIIDPDLYKRYKNSCNDAMLPLATRATRKNDNSIWLGKIILINQDTPWQRGLQDLPDGWCAMAYFGDYQQGQLCLPQLKITLATQPGDLVLLRSAALVQFAAQWVGEGRYVVVYFTHANVMEFFENDRKENIEQKR